MTTVNVITRIYKKWQMKEIEEDKWRKQKNTNYHLTLVFQYSIFKNLISKTKILLSSYWDCIEQL